MTNACVAVIGDYQSENPTHTAIATAIAHSNGSKPRATGLRWVPTEEADQFDERALGDIAGFWTASGSPYRSMQGAFAGCRVRTRTRPATAWDMRAAPDHHWFLNATHAEAI